jgi:GNAT superfamily N-acetyltransferase
MSAAAPEPAAVQVRPLRHPRRFLDLQRVFYRGDRDFVPPLPAGEAWQIDPRKNPFFEHAEAEFLALHRNGRPVARISATRDRLHDEFHGDRVGFFGHFEAADEAAAHAALAAAESWLRAHGATAMRGPVDLSTNYRCGLLVEGEPGPPVMVMPYNPKAYASWLESYGLEKAKDLLALKSTKASIDLRRIGRVVEHVRRKQPATLRPLDLRHFAAECEVLWDLYHRIWERNWGFVPMSRDEFLAQARDLKKLAHPALLHVAESSGKPIGFVVALPDVNAGIRACDGRLLPFGWLRLLRAIKRVRTLRVITLGVVPEHRRTGVELLMMHAVIEKGLAAGFDTCEASWILEDNRDMLGPLETLGHAPYRRYRIYEKALA